MTTFPITTLPTDPPEWRLLNVDMSDNVNGVLVITDLGVLDPIDAKLYLKQNDPGSGELNIPLTSPRAAQVKTGQFVSLSYRGAYRGGFFIESRELIDATSSEYAGLAIKISGRGPMALLDDAIVYDWLTPDVENTRKFGLKNTLIVPAVSVPKGEMIYRLMDEAENYQTNPSGQHLTRYCWRTGQLGDAGDPATPPIGEPLLTFDFTITQDSVGNNWSDLEDMEYRVGTSLLDVMRQIAALGLSGTPPIVYDFAIERDMTQPLLFILHAYAFRLGSDLSATIHFRVGTNCEEVSRKYNGADVRNHILVEFSDPAVPYTHVEDTAFMLAFRRRESLLQASNASNVTTATNYGNAELDFTKNTTKDISIKISDAVAPALFIDYNLGDSVNYDNGYGAEQKRKITGLQLSWTGDQQYADVVVEMA